MKTTPTTGGDAPSPEAEALPTLPVVAWQDHDWVQAERPVDACSEFHRWRPLTPHAPAEAAIVALRAEVERLTMQVENLSAEGQLAYKVSENVGRNALQCAQDLLQDKLALTAEVAELRKVEERYLWLRNDMATEFGEPWAITRYAPGDERNSDGGTCPLIGAELDAAIDAARASLLGDGGTL
jgi:hypothetical protein